MTGVAGQGYAVEVSHRERSRRQLTPAALFEARRHLVLLLAQSGYTLSQIAAILNSTKPTVARYRRAAPIAVAS